MRDWQEKAKRLLSRDGQEFAATLIEDNDKFFIFDWRDTHGSGNLATRYVIDRENGNVIITGDAGKIKRYI